MGQSLPHGTRFGDYRIESLIGQGGLSEVYSAREMATGRSVALKLLEARRFGDPKVVERLRREALALKQIRHQNVVVVHAAGVTDGRPWIAMDRLSGQTLRARLGAEPALGLVEALEIAAALLDGLEAAHRRKIVHRDMKPENVFLTDDGGLKIVDFGNAKLLDFGLRTTDPHHTFGTAAYMAPEQLALRSRVGPACDLYAVGLMLWEMLAGRHPFCRSDDPDDLPPTAELCRLQLEERPRALNAVRPDLPKEISELVGRLVSKRPQDRPGSAFACAQTVRSFRHQALQELQGTPAPARPRLLEFRLTVPWALLTGAMLGTVAVFAFAVSRAQTPLAPARSDVLDHPSSEKPAPAAARVTPPRPALAQASASPPAPDLQAPDLQKRSGAPSESGAPKIDPAAANSGLAPRVGLNTSKRAPAKVKAKRPKAVANAARPRSEPSAAPLAPARESVVLAEEPLF